MLLEVEITYSKCDDDWEVNVYDREDRERVEDLERVYPTRAECEEYVESLVRNKKYDVVHI